MKRYSRPESGQTSRERLWESLGYAAGQAETNRLMDVRQREFVAALLRGGALIFGKPVDTVRFVDGQPFGWSNEEIARLIERKSEFEPEDVGRG